jgi:hypothetical protein
MSNCYANDAENLGQILGRPVIMPSHHNEYGMMSREERPKRSTNCVVLRIPKVAMLLPQETRRCPFSQDSVQLSARNRATIGKVKAAELKIFYLNL